MANSADTDALKQHLGRIRANIGETRGPLTLKVEPHILMNFSRAIGETNPLYLDEAYARTTRFGGLIAPPTFVSYFLTQLVERMYDLDMPGFRHLHSDDIGDEQQPIRAGDTITATARFRDAWLHEGRSRPILFQSAETVLTNQHDQSVASARMIVVSFR
jgi:acyl dehydratase